MTKGIALARKWIFGGKIVPATAIIGGRYGSDATVVVEPLAA
jgi:hypothetical protein